MTNSGSERRPLDALTAGNQPTTGVRRDGGKPSAGQSPCESHRYDQTMSLLFRKSIAAYVGGLSTAFCQAMVRDALGQARMRLHAILCWLV